MCIVCVEWQAGKLTSKEALKNLGEMAESIGQGSISDVEHYFEAVGKILDKEVPLEETDKELDKKWHEETHDGNE